eukprot:6212469-Pleurochrysis_carterae.AAC.1
MNAAGLRVRQLDDAGGFDGHRKVGAPAQPGDPGALAYLTHSWRDCQLARKRRSHKEVRKAYTDDVRDPSRTELCQRIVASSTTCLPVAHFLWLAFPVKSDRQPISRLHCMKKSACESAVERLVFAWVDQWLRD